MQQCSWFPLLTLSLTSFFAWASTSLRPEIITQSNGRAANRQLRQQEGPAGGAVSARGEYFEQTACQRFGSGAHIQVQCCGLGSQALFFVVMG